MKRVISAFLLILCLLNATCYSEEDDLGAWAESITQKYATIAARENLPYKFYKVTAEKRQYSTSGSEKTNYVSRSSDFTISGSWSSSFTINYALFDYGFTIGFVKEESPSLVRDFFTLTLMVVYGLDHDKAVELTSQIAPSYDGKSRSNYIKSDKYVVYIRPYVIGGSEIVMVEREYYNDVDTSKYKAMNYTELTTYLNQDELAWFSGTVMAIMRGETEDTLLVQMDSGEAIELIVYRGPGYKIYIYEVGETYDFYVRIGAERTNHKKNTFDILAAVKN